MDKITLIGLIIAVNIPLVTYIVSSAIAQRPIQKNVILNKKEVYRINNQGYEELVSCEVWQSEVKKELEGE